LKKTPKNTSTMTSRILDSMPRPNARMNTDPSTMRGMEFSTLMYGLKTSARKRIRPSAIPQKMPNAVPMKKPMMASSRVTLI